MFISNVLILALTAKAIGAPVPDASQAVGRALDVVLEAYAGPLIYDWDSKKEKRETSEDVLPEAKREADDKRAADAVPEAYSRALIYDWDAKKA